MKGNAAKSLTAVFFWLAAVFVCAAGSPVSAQNEILIEKSTNGEDADLPPGPFVPVGSTVNWTYFVTNGSGRDLVNLSVTDDQGVTVSCPGTTLGAGESMTCMASGTAVAGQYANVGTATAEQPDGSVVSDTDPSHYFGETQAAVTIEKATEGVDADTPPGPSLPVGGTVNWTYTVTNTGPDPLSEIEVTDDQGVSVSCPGTTLAVGASMTCTGSGTVQPGQYSNLGTVTALLPSEDTVGDSDPSHYFGQTLLIEKRTNGFDADLPPGPVVDAGSTVVWTYAVSNPGPATVTGVAVTDDQGVAVSCPSSTLAAGESMTCMGSGVAQAGQYANVGTATALLPAGGTVSASDPSHYLGRAIRLEKLTNGQDADLPPGPVVAVGSTVSWDYVVTNLGPDPLTNVAVTDDQGVTVTCPGTVLAGNSSMTCTASGVAQAGQYTNVGTVTADDASFQQIADSDPSHYFGQDQVLDFGDAGGLPYPTLFAANGARHLLGSGVYLGACVDSELDGQPAAAAAGDDLAAGLSTFGTCAVPGDDEDGVTFTTPLLAGSTANVSVVASAACTLSAWIDFNADGDWSDAGEALFPGGAAVAAGLNPLSFAVPANASAGATAARFRCTTGGEVMFVGEASDGEVEDYQVTLVQPNPVVSATKTAALTGDVDGDGMADPGDTLTYTIVITNSGSGAASGVALTDTPDPNTALVNGSVTTTAGTVTSGNGVGDTSVSVNAGVLAGGGASVTVTFQVTIDAPLPPNVFQISNQGQVSGSNAPTVPTDDPAAPGAGDATVVSLGQAPAVEIPALGEGGLLLLALLLGGLGLRRMAAARG